MRICLLILISWLIPISLFSQVFPVRKHIADSFRYPLSIPMKLNANFGEVRPNHFHMGLDLFTERRENLPVYAPADGWVSKLRIDPTGFGNAVFLTHPNGYTTLYAHMNSFPPKTLRALIAGQYAKQSWKGDVVFNPEQFPVTRGEFIGYSGNTGASAGPHVHYEIRRTEGDACLNGLFFHPLSDKLPPRIRQLAVYDRNKSTYDQTPQVIVPLRAGDAYTLSSGMLTVNSSRISLAIDALDQINGATNVYGIYQAVVYLDDIPVSGFQLDSVSYAQTRYLNAHIDFRLRAKGSAAFQHLTPLPGDCLPIYYTKGDGILQLQEGKTHRLKLIATDTYGNSATFQCSIRYSGTAEQISNKEKDSRYMLPNQINVFETEEVQLISSEKSFYDAFRLDYTVRPDPAGISNSYLIHNQTIPIHDSVRYRIKSLKPLTEEESKHVVMIRTGNGKKDIRRTSVSNHWYEARFRDFGEFRLVLDKQAPVLKVTGLTAGMTVENGHTITCTVSDNLEKIHHFRAEIDGSWIMFTGNGPVYRYQVDEYCKPGDHVLKLLAEDEAGNSIIQEIAFKRK